MASMINFNVNPTGGAILVEFIVQQVIADWGAKHLRNQQKLSEWGGMNNDNVADVAPIDPATVLAGDEVGWGVLLFGPAAAMQVTLTVRVRQDNSVMSDVRQVQLAAQQATAVADVIQFV